MATSDSQNGLIENLDVVIGKVLETALAPFTHYTMGVALFFLLIILALISTWLAYSRAKVANKELDNAVQALSKASDEVDFTELFDEIDSSIKQNSILKRPWEEFVETLIPPLDAVDDPQYRVYRNTKRPQEFFKPEEVLKDVRPLMDGERLIGIGLIFTFIGLIAALSKASGAFTGDENITFALATLLSTAGAKFLASIGGLGGSIIQSMISNRVISRSISKLSTFNDALEERLSFASVERISADHFGHAQRQTARLEEMGTEITLALGDRISQAMASMPQLMGAEFGKALEPMKASLESVTTQMSQNNTDALSNMVGEFREQIQGAGEQSMKVVIKQLDGLSSTLSSTINGLQISNDEMRAGLREAIGAMSTATTQFSESISSSANAASGQMDQMTANLDKTVKTLLHDFQSQQDESQSAMRELIERLSASSNQATNEVTRQAEKSSKQLANSLNEALEKILNGAANSTDALANTVKESMENVTQQAQIELNQLLNDLGAEIRQRVANVGTSLNAWKESTSQVSSSLNRINTELDKTSSGLLTSTERIHDAGIAFKGVAATVESATSPLYRISEKLASTVESMEKINQETFKSVDSISQSVQQSVEEVSSSLSELKSTWERHAGHLQGVDQELETAFRSISTNLASSLEALQRFSSDLGIQVGDITDNFASIVQELTDAIEEMTNKRN